MKNKLLKALIKLGLKSGIIIDTNYLERVKVVESSEISAVKKWRKENPKVRVDISSFGVLFMEDVGLYVDPKPKTMPIMIHGFYMIAPSLENWGFFWTWVKFQIVKLLFPKAFAQQKIRYKKFKKLLERQGVNKFRIEEK